MKAGSKQPKRERRRSPVRRPREEQVSVSPCARPAAVAAAQAEAEEAVAPEEGHGHSAKKVEFLGHLEDNRAWRDQLARDKFVSEAVRGQRLEFDSRPSMSLPTRPHPQRMGNEKNWPFNRTFSHC